jgi:hypothetical protein
MNDSTAAPNDRKKDVHDTTDFESLVAVSSINSWIVGTCQTFRELVRFLGLKRDALLGD